jgi:hypothetical protein
MKTGLIGVLYAFDIVILDPEIENEAIRSTISICIGIMFSENEARLLEDIVL